MAPSTRQAEGLARWQAWLRAVDCLDCTPEQYAPAQVLLPPALLAPFEMQHAP